jgi:transcriptional regulator with XRE-family HTH domain
MRLRSPEILRAFMDQKKFSMARLARYADCSKAMIGYLCKGEKDGKPFATCSEPLAKAIAEALDVPWEALFDREESAVSVRNSGNRQKAAAAA